ncbi:hypothetical protein, partial [Sphingobacterium mizutaii]|uniref:hypothetical protein n=1 Tax=Sphingobacterium mizutaii TaxID=1010 RepID=UPI0028AB72DA
RWYCRNRWESRSVPNFIRKPAVNRQRAFCFWGLWGNHGRYKGTSAWKDTNGRIRSAPTEWGTFRRNGGPGPSSHPIHPGQPTFLSLQPHS